MFFISMFIIDLETTGLLSAEGGGAGAAIGFEVILLGRGFGLFLGIQVYLMNNNYRFTLLNTLETVLTII